jgi:hypothetical protein
MDIYLAGCCNLKKQKKDFDRDGLLVLESFSVLHNKTESWMLPYIDGKRWQFMLDSGAFTFMQSTYGRNATSIEGIDWNDYVLRYADFIIRHDVDLFCELDIDVVIGYEKVLQLRQLLEARVGRQCIPVWHRARGLEEWKSVVKDYDYVAIGGIVSGEIGITERRFFKPLCKIAHEHNAYVHGLGLSIEHPNALGCCFDSVDSTTWNTGNRGGFVFRFNGKRLIRLTAPEGCRLKGEEASIHNFREWVKYQRYMKHAG